MLEADASERLDDAAAEPRRRSG